MGTRGCYGFRKNGVDKLTYNHFDSYPDYLGRHIIQFCKETSIEEMNEIFDRIHLVNGRFKPDSDHIKECMPYYNGNVGNQSIHDWYCLLREAQGNLNVYKNGLKYMVDDVDFIKDSLFCEYAYIINLDTNELEFWVGFQKEPDPSNRYGTESDSGYYPCKMVGCYPLDIIHTEKYSVDDYLEDMNEMSK